MSAPQRRKSWLRLCGDPSLLAVCIRRRQIFGKNANRSAKQRNRLGCRLRQPTFCISGSKLRNAPARPASRIVIYLRFHLCTCAVPRCAVPCIHFIIHTVCCVLSADIINKHIWWHHVYATGARLHAVCFTLAESAPQALYIYIPSSVLLSNITYCARKRWQSVSRILDVFYMFYTQRSERLHLLWKC